VASVARTLPLAIIAANFRLPLGTVTKHGLTRSIVPHELVCYTQLRRGNIKMERLERNSGELPAIPCWRNRSFS
jgi:hypothetical protein